MKVNSLHAEHIQTHHVTQKAPSPEISVSARLITSVFYCLVLRAIDCLGCRAQCQAEARVLSEPFEGANEEVQRI